MFALMLIECLVLIDAFLSVEQRSAIMGNAILRSYFFVSLISCGIQLVGIVMVEKRWYRLGGILQITASVVHIWEIEGIVGILGGMDAYDYPAVLAESAKEKAQVEPELEPIVR